MEQHFKRCHFLSLSAVLLLIRGTATFLVVFTVQILGISSGTDEINSRLSTSHSLPI